jgi:hypothetical protein
MNFRKTKITIENYRRTILRTRRNPVTARCEFCESQTLMISPNEAAALLHKTAREIFRLTETGEIHFFETATGALLICRNSLTALEKQI